MDNRVADVLEKQGRSKTWLAGELGISRTWLYRLLNDQEEWPGEQRAAVAQLLGEPPDMLFTDNSD